MPGCCTNASPTRSRSTFRRSAARRRVRERFLGEPRATPTCCAPKYRCRSAKRSRGGRADRRSGARHLRALRRPRRNVDRTVRRARHGGAIAPSPSRCASRFRPASPTARVSASACVAANALVACASKSASPSTPPDVTARRSRRRALHRLGAADDRSSACRRWRSASARCVIASTRAARQSGGGGPDGRPLRHARRHRHPLGRRARRRRACRCGAASPGRG